LVAGDWLTYHGSTTRDGYDSNLPNVTTLSLGWKTHVDGPVYAEPVSFNGSIFVVTENDTIYSLSQTTGQILWSFQAGTPANSTAAPYACNGGEPTITPIIGITGTPVIDPSTSTLYAVALNSGVNFTLFAVNTNTGLPRWSSSIGASGFDFLHQEQRGALTLANGLIYVPFGSYSWSCGNPTGWLFGISANGNGTQYSYQVTNTNEADIWTPEGASVDSAGFVYVVTGNSYYNATFNYADSVIKLTPHLTVVNYFTPSNWAALGPDDLDQDTTGATILPDNLIFSIGKSGIAYLLNSTDLGGAGGQLASLPLCLGGAWGSTSYYDGVVYIPCYSGLYAVAVHTGAHPSLTSLWNATLGFMGPPIIAGGVVWTLGIDSGTLYALNPTTGAIVTSISLISGEGLAHFSTPSVAGKLLVFAGDDTVFALNPASSSASTTGTSSGSAVSTSTSTTSTSSSATSTAAGSMLPASIGRSTFYPR
jgi:outer membrane protein assembly factor BamB